MKKNRPTFDRIGLYVNVVKDTGFQGSYTHFRAHAITIGRNEYERRRIDEGASVEIAWDGIRNAPDEWITTPAGRLYLHDLTVEATGSDAYNDRELYGFSVHYRQPFAVELNHAERMAHTLRTIARRMDKQNRTLGHPLSFGQYVARVALAIGAEVIAMPDGEQYGSSYADNTHRRHTLGDGASYIDGMARAYRNERKSA
jgi:hypothetical protein